MSNTPESDELEEILGTFARNAGLPEDHSLVAETKSAIEQHINRKVVEARINELQHFYDVRSEDFITWPQEVVEVINDTIDYRIKALQTTSKEKT